jgi:hypothetical protein
LSYLPIEDLLLFRSTCKRALKTIDLHWHKRLVDMAVQIENLKLEQFGAFNKKIPLLYEGGFLSPYLKMLDQVIFREKNFITRGHLSEIKQISN